MADHSYGFARDPYAPGSIYRKESFILLYLFSLCFIFWLSMKICKDWKLTSIPVAGVTMVCGIIIFFVTSAFHVQDVFISFNANLFFLLLLPPIIFASGLQLNYRLFVANYLTIMTFANLGTIISMIVTAYVLYGMGSLGLTNDVSVMECFAFGALISATDPVATLAVFADLHVDPILNTIVLASSILDDAIAFILFTTFNKFIVGDIDLTYAVATIIIYFLTSLIGSILIGSLEGLVFAWFVKMNGSFMEEPKALACFVMALVYISYFSAQVLQLSGIISCLMAAIIFKRHFELFAHVNHVAQLDDLMSIIAQLMETAVFFSMGLAVFYCHDTFANCNKWSVSFSFCSIFAVVVGRVAQVYPLSAALNWYHRSLHIPAPSREHFSKNLAEENQGNDKKMAIRMSPLRLPPEISKMQKNCLPINSDDVQREQPMQKLEEGDIEITLSPIVTSSVRAQVVGGREKIETDLDDGSVLRNPFQRLIADNRESYQGRRPGLLSVGAQHMIMLAGLRGPIAYASAQIIDAGAPNAAVLYNATKLIVLATILLKGSATLRGLKWTKVPFGLDLVREVEALQRHLPEWTFRSPLLRALEMRVVEYFQQDRRGSARLSVEEDELRPDHQQQHSVAVADG